MNKRTKYIIGGSILGGLLLGIFILIGTLIAFLAKKRQKHVLNKMVEYGYISKEEANTIK